MCTVVVIGFFEISIPDLAKSFTGVMAVVLESLDTSLTIFLSRIFEIFGVRSMPAYDNFVYPSPPVLA